MVTPFTIGQQPPSTEPIPEVTMGSVGMDFSKLIGGQVQVFNSTPDTETGQKRKRKSSTISSGGSLITDTLDDSNTSTRQLSMVETNDPYEQKYSETDAMLKSAVAQIDSCLSEVHDDIASIRASKTMRSKYTYLSNLQGAMGALIGNKIAAARELNNTITKCNDLELRRWKESRSVAMADEKDDNRRLQEMYQAFVSTPIGGRFTQPLGPSTAEMSVPGNGIMSSSLGNTDQQYSDYLMNMSPAQNTQLLMETNPNIKQVVVYNQQTGAKYFDVIDMSTGQSIPNADKHDAMFLEDITINQRDLIATNTNLGESYPLVIVGQPILNEY